MKGRTIAILTLLTMLSSVLVVASCTEVSADITDVTIDGVLYEIEDNEATATETVDQSLRILTVPESIIVDGKTYPVIGLGPYIVSGSSIASLHIPSTVRTIDGIGLSGSSLTEITVDPGNQWFTVVDNVLFTKDMTCIVRYCPGNTATEYVIPSPVVEIGASAFESCRLISVEIPDGVYIISTGAFESCHNLERINNRDGMNHLPSKLIMIDVVAFSNCTSLDNIELNEGLKCLGDLSFYRCTSLTEIGIPYSLTSIGSGCFNGCSSLERFTMEEDNRSVGVIDDVLYGISDDKPRTLISYPGSKGDEVFEIPDTVTSISFSAFSVCPYLKEVHLSDSMNTVSMGAFFGCVALETVVGTEKLLSISDMAFNSCSNLTNLIGFDDVRSIGMFAFNGCGFTELTIPSSVTDIGVYAFSGCESLESVMVPQSVKYIGMNAFSSCYSLKTIEFLGTSVEFDEGALSIGDEDGDVEVTVIVPNGMSLPDDVGGEFTDITVVEKGKRPYPYENLIGVAICILVLLFIVRRFGRVQA